MPAESVDYPPGDPRRPHNYVGSPGFYMLSQACAAIRAAFPGCPVLLVGSSVTSKQWRDIDVRVVVPDARYKELFPGIGDYPGDHALWSQMCTGTALWLRQASGLPVDFQIQSRSRAALESGQVRELGLFPESAGGR